MANNLCPACLKHELEDDLAPWEGSPVCPKCSLRIPPSLLKACGDPFDYALMLSNGRYYRFARAEIHGDWVTIHAGATDAEESFQETAFPYGCPRGVEIRLSEIVWCADAPEGS